MRNPNVARPLRRVGLVAAGTVVLTLTGVGTAAAERPDSWTEGPALSGLQVIGIYVGIPLALVLLITVLVLAPSWIRGPQYQPGLSWWSRPVWFNGPEGAEELARGGASTAAGPETTEGGGASARW